MSKLKETISKKVNIYRLDDSWCGTCPNVEECPYYEPEQ